MNTMLKITRNISEDFYENIYLLSLAEQPSSQFLKEFRPDMFNKQNTPGFICVSQFLLNVYDHEHCRKVLVPWPVLCKQDEVKFRNNAKDFICKVADENPDLNFPPILSSHFVHAKGQIFMIIMYKLSQAVLSAYIKREAPNECVVYHPRPSSISEKFIEKLTIAENEKCQQLLNEINQKEEEANEFAREQVSEVHVCKSKVNERKQLLSDTVKSAPVNNSTIRNQLLDCENDKILLMWKAAIKKDINYMEQKSEFLHKLENLSQNVKDLFERVTNHSNILDGNNFPKIDTEKVAELLPPQLQMYAHRLYEDNSVPVLHNLFVIFSFLLNQFGKQFQNMNVSNLIPLNSQLQASCDDMKIMNDILQEEYGKCTDLTCHIKATTQEKQSVNIFRTLPYTMSDSLLTSSPPIQINLQPEDGKTEHLNRLKLTPVEGPHQGLFTKYKFMTNTSSSVQISMPVMRINFEDINLNKSESPTVRRRMLAPKTPWASVKKAQKYSRLFSTFKKTNDANISMMSLPCTSKANSTSVMNTIGEELTLDISGKSFFNSTEKAISPKRDVPQIAFTEMCHIPLENKSMIKEFPSASFTSFPPDCSSNTMASQENQINDNTNIATEETKKERKRRSISDLVERYRKLGLKNSSPAYNLQDIPDEPI